MRVKIQHSVNIDDVEDKIADLLEDSISHIMDAQSLSRDLITLVGIKASYHKHKIALDMIHNIREQLANYDNVLNDVSGIIEGLHNYHERLEKPTEASPEQVRDVVDSITERFSNIAKEANDADEG